MVADGSVRGGCPYFKQYNVRLMPSGEEDLVVNAVTHFERGIIRSADAVVWYVWPPMSCLTLDQQQQNATESRCVPETLK